MTNAQPSLGDGRRTVGLLGATGVGVGAIVGGGILILGGVALQRTGPSAWAAFALSGVVALLTAASVAEVATRFPESGGTYTFARKVLSVRAAFGVGWILWFAHIVAGVLYAMGFASYALEAFRTSATSLGLDMALHPGQRGPVAALGTAATAMYAISIARRSTGGGEWATWGKVFVFAVFLGVGGWALAKQPAQTTLGQLTPHFPAGLTGVVMAAGFTFIALQGFEIIATLGGEVKDPARLLPRSMFLSLGIALAIYLPLLLLIVTVGFDPAESIRKAADRNPETVIASAVGRFMGGPGYWLVVAAAILSTLSALRANMVAASQVAHAMARDRTLPLVLSRLHAVRRTPVMAIGVTSLAVVGTMLMLPNLESAGAAASLIFLLSFAITHGICFLARRRSFGEAAPFQTPLFPLFPISGIVMCGGLAVFQSIVAPAAGAIVLLWLLGGTFLYFSLFASRAETWDASSEAHDLALARFRGRAPFVLVPVANPSHVPALLAVASALSPPGTGRVLLLTIVPTPGSESDDQIRTKLGFAHDVLKESFQASYPAGRVPEVLITAASVAWEEIRRVAAAHSCESVLLGLGPLTQEAEEPQVRELMDQLESDVALLRAPHGWRFDRVKSVLVPVGGRGVQHELRARLLGTLRRVSACRVIFLRVAPPDLPESELQSARREMQRQAMDSVPGEHETKLIRSDDPAEAIVSEAHQHDLVVLGLQRKGGRTVFGSVNLRVAQETGAATIMLSQRR